MDTAMIFGRSEETALGSNRACAVVAALRGDHHLDARLDLRGVRITSMRYQI
jgi:hypothetical protein